jgi:uncharacterized delta-60 repeat protein
MILQNDGKILIGGNVSGGGFSLQRLNTDGTPDASFGPDGTGRSTPQFPDGQDATVLALAIQKKTLPGGGVSEKIIAAGMLNQDMWGSVFPQGDFAVARFNLDGSLDTSFGNGGVVITDLPEHSLLTSVGQQSDGKIVVGGFSPLGSTSEPVFAVAIRYTVDGVIDPSFGDSGIASVGYGPEFLYTDSYAMAIQPDDKIILGGYVTTTYFSNYSPQFNFDIGLMRLNSNGSLDPTFGVDGKVITE